VGQRENPLASGARSRYVPRETRAPATIHRRDMTFEGDDD
jgi:hypothetical protein